MKTKVCGMACTVFLLLVWIFPAGAAAPQAKIVRDSFGVPHIYADSLEGLFFGYGYAAAQDRLYQMEMFRRTYWGRLSEVYGEKLLAFDQSNRRDNFTLREMQRQVEALDPELQTVLRSFAAGINAYITEALADRANKLPKEFHHFGFEPEPWNAEDVAADFLSVMGFFMDISGELANASMLNYLTERYGKEKGRIMFHDWCWGLASETPTTIAQAPNSHPQKAEVAIKTRWEHPLMAAILKAAPGAYDSWVKDRLAQSLLMAQARPFLLPTSYALVLSPSKSTSGKALLMGGPQFMFQLPSALYEVGLHGAGIDAVGSTLAGYPFVMFGHNRRASFSSTAGADNIEDFFAEKLNASSPRQYWFKGTWRDMEVRSELFRVKDKTAPVVTEFTYTVHGPVFYTDEKNHVAFSKRLSCREHFLEGLGSFYDLMKAETAADFEKAGQRSDMSINFFFANVDGDIAYFHQGLHPIRSPEVDPRLPTPGTGEFEWKGYIPKSRNPHVLNPASGYIANWNNQPEPGWSHGDMATTDVWGGWGSDSRDTCLVRLAEEKKDLSREDVKKIIKTIAFYDKRATNIKGLMLEAVKEVNPKLSAMKMALDQVAQWNNLAIDANKDGYVDHPGAAIFDRWWKKAIPAVFGDEFEGYKNPLGQTAVQLLSNRYLGYTLFFEALRGNTGVDYFNGQKAQVLYRALEEAVDELGKEHPGKAVSQYRMKTPLDQFHPVSVLGYFLMQPITSTVGTLPPFPSVDRGTENHIVNLGPTGIQAENVTAPGASGLIKADGTKSPHFADQMEMFVGFTYKPMLFTDAQVKEAARSTQVVEWK
jgi:penicillin amidase